MEVEHWQLWGVVVTGLRLPILAMEFVLSRVMHYKRRIRKLER